MKRWGIISVFNIYTSIALTWKTCIICGKGCKNVLFWHDKLQFDVCKEVKTFFRRLSTEENKRFSHVVVQFCAKQVESESGGNESRAPDCDDILGINRLLSSSLKCVCVGVGGWFPPVSFRGRRWRRMSADLWPLRLVSWQVPGLLSFLCRRKISCSSVQQVELQ